MSESVNQRQPGEGRHLRRPFRSHKDRRQAHRQARERALSLPPSQTLIFLSLFTRN